MRGTSPSSVSGDPMPYASLPMKLLFGVSLLASAGYGPAGAQTSQQPFEQIARFDHQVTGVAVSQDGRVFVNFPRWTEDSPVSVAEVMKDGSTRPYPDERWNSWRNAKKN